jgi:general secretion pathway protein G
MRQAQSGFTLIEILFAILIIGSIMAGVFIGIRRAMESFDRSKAKTTLGNIEFAIGQYRINVQKLPTKLDELVKGPKEEKDKKRWVQGGGPFLEEDQLTDPWGNKYVYKPTPGGKKQYDLFSYGPNGPEAPNIEHISVGGE